MKNILFIVPSWINFSLSNIYIAQIKSEMYLDEYIKLIKAAENSFKKIVIYTNDFPEELLNWLYKTDRNNDKYTVKIIDNQEAREKLKDYLEINWEWINNFCQEEEDFDKRLDQFIINNREILKRRLK